MIVPPHIDSVFHHQRFFVCGSRYHADCFRNADDADDADADGGADGGVAVLQEIWFAQYLTTTTSDAEQLPACNSEEPANLVHPSEATWVCEYIPLPFLGVGFPTVKLILSCGVLLGSLRCSMLPKNSLRLHSGYPSPNWETWKVEYTLSSPRLQRSLHEPAASAVTRKYVHRICHRF